ncbi:SDR family oxidoreductase [Bordetella pseudohinzii]|uniref:NmrA family transcriptional regulator n=1 Tax=Bordetella pseudohinzii TaxID=1331258 RepID=A0A0J6BVF6_9BORD|nr:SDR family oxidoreductase [Bordetella pseudohinzii]ANY17527.1 NmrA family transcriptional regulator [Bordetella pseudohinzii]KMM25754.1 NmrA family transcriptional regulator [Bordetella pseudohinzii]KXA81744.1 NmrA family transcriptional regulator [Bordetella pseudohinzii]KXA83017.1 NmrA family transcriptional regulator [Bordetella pseudohinzii]CUI73198.1 Putative NADH-flavin reductase [Bordetella pseudohinzii]
MKILVIGGTGLIGSKLVKRLIARGHEAIAASPATGVNTLTGEGLDAALAGVETVVDVANSPSFEDQAVLAFFQTSGRNLLAAEARAGVRHHVALSVVGTHRLADSGYFRGKIAQENLIKAGNIPYTIVQSTQFFEFLGGIVQSGTVGDEVRLARAFVQPIASDDVAQAMADVALAPPLNDTVEIAGPDRVPLAELARRYMDKMGDTRALHADPGARYFGALLDEDTLLPGPRLGSIDFETWFERSGAPTRGQAQG